MTGRDVTERLAEAAWLIYGGDPSWGFANLTPASQELHREQARKFLLPVVEAIAAERLREFVGWVAVNRAFNGSDHPHAQSLYNEHLNAALPEWADQWLRARAADATSGGAS